MSRFFCDSNCELDYNRFDEFDIELIKMPYTIDGQEYAYDLGRNTDLKDFFAKMRAGSVAKTQALNELNYTEYFEPFLKKGEDILYVTFTHKMSATFLYMDNAIKDLLAKYPERKITTVDTMHISMGAGFIVYEAAKLHKSGATDEQIVKFVEEFRQKVNTYFTVDDLVYLKRGGRLSSFKALMGTMLNLKPIIYTNKEGALESLTKAKGRKKALIMLLEKLETNNIDLSYPIVIIDADCKDGNNFLVDIIKEKYNNANIWTQDIGPVVGAHCGPDTVGVIFVSK